MNGNWKPCIINVEVRIWVPKVQRTTQNMPNSPHSQYLALFCSKVQFFECINTFSMDIEVRNDRIPRNLFYRQLLDMLY